MFSHNAIGLPNHPPSKERRNPNADLRELEKRNGYCQTQRGPQVSGAKPLLLESVTEDPLAEKDDEKHPPDAG
jgi:hypothetical protein